MARDLNVQGGEIRFINFSGINNVADASNLKLEELAEAYNVDIDNEGRVSRRDGYTKKYTPSNKTHSMWSNDRMCLFIDGSSLMRLNTDYSADTLRVNVTTLPMEYVDVNENVYYSNASVNGFIDSLGVNNLHADSGVKYKDIPPTGQHIEFYNGRIYIARNHTLWFTDVFAFSRVDKRYNAIEFKDEITMVKAVDDGLYISIGDINERSQTVFLGGNDPSEFVQKIVADYGAIEGTATKPNEAFIGDGISGQAVLWASRKGICLGGNGGSFRNLTAGKYEVPSNRYGSGFFRINNGVPQYIASLWT
jgi:hypothetical protein